MKALVVDDDLTSRLVLEDVLSRFGRVDSCADGEEAVRAVHLALDQGDAYDVISLDLVMPTMHGLEALQRIREEEERQGQPHTAKVLVVTGSEDQASINQAFGRLCDAYIVKPIEVEGLLNVLACLCPVEEPS
jgi:two-component system chemotaxis response regulator CheY